MLCTTFSLILAAVSTTVLVDARPAYVARIPNGANVDGVPALGHLNPQGGGANNQFGLDFESAGEVWVPSFCQQDSDGDGQTNGQELGDPCCEWVQDSNAVTAWSTGVSHPGDNTSMSDPSLWANVVCTNATMSNMTAAANGTDGVGIGGTDDTDATVVGPDAPTDAPVSTSSATLPVTPAICSTIAVVAGVAAFFM